jgi:hypothetical protein
MTKGLLRGLMMTACLLYGAALPVWGQGVAGERLKQLKQKQAARQKQLPPAIPGPAIERLQRMSPEQREQALAKLPPERRQQMEQRLKRLERLTPEQRDLLDQRYQAFQSLPPGRRVVVRAAMQQLRSMPEADRRARLNSEEAKRRFSPQELQLLREVSGVPENSPAE